jgi:serine protease Do
MTLGVVAVPFAILMGVSSARAAEAPAVPTLVDFPAIVRERGPAVVRVETLEHYLPGLVRRTARLLNPFPLHKVPGDAVSFVFYVPTLVFYPLRKHLGSGVFIAPDGYLLTNDHVVQNADKFTIRFTDAKGVRRKLEAKLVGTDRQTDIALLKVEPDKVPLAIAPLGDSDQLALGEWILAIGNPMNLTGSVSVGVVSGLHRQLGANFVEDYVQVEAPLNPGNSGGPILNARGEVVGIAAIGLFPANNIGFAVPMGLIAPYLDDFKKRGRPSRGYLGITVRDITPDLAEEEELDVQEGILVTDVGFFSPAGRAGIEEGDVLVSYGGRKLEKARDLQMAVLRTRPGITVPIVVRREGKLVDLKAKVTERRIPFRLL